MSDHNDLKIFIMQNFSLPMAELKAAAAKKYDAPSEAVHEIVAGLLVVR